MPPITLALAALLLLAMVLPSALTVPERELASTASFAPVPPEPTSVTAPDAAPPAEATSDSVGVPDDGGAGDGTGDGTGTGGGPLPTVVEGEGRTDVDYVCGRWETTAGTIRRQTEDPRSPPCNETDFTGDNGGATAPGVTRDEVFVTFYLDGGWAPGCGEVAQGRDCELPVGLVDVEEPPSDGDAPGMRTRHPQLDILRDYLRHFNSRYNLHGRRVRLIAHFSDADREPEADRRSADAITAFAQVRPFATVSHPRFGQEEVYLREVADRAIVTFARRGMLLDDLFEERPGFVWATTPTAEVDVDNYVGLLCRQVVGRPPTASGNTDRFPGPDRPPMRRLGIIRTTDPDHPGIVAAGQLVMERLDEECEGTIAVDVTYDECCHTRDVDELTAEEDVLRLRNAGVTTVLIPGGEAAQHVRSAQALGYEPEWIILGDGENDGWLNIEIGEKEQAFAGRAFLVSDLDLLHAEGGECDPPEGGDPLPCCEHFLSPDFRETWSTWEIDSACEFYDVLRLLFSSLQTAGPRLHPRILERGLRAADLAPHPEAAAHCRFGPTRHTCIDDALLLWWDDSRGPIPGRQRLGCWRAGDANRRFSATEWPDRDVADVLATEGPCSRYVGGSLSDLTPERP